MADSPVQLRDSVRKIRKRVVSVIRRRSSSKNPKSRSGSEEHSHHDDSEHEHEHDNDHGHESEHSHSAASSTHSLNKSPGSRPSSPPPSGVLTPPSGSHRRLSITGFSFPRTPSRKNKTKSESVPTSPPVRARTISTPGGTSPVESTPGKLTLPIPTRPRTLSHPLAASPIMPASPENAQDKDARTRPGHERAMTSPGTSGIGALASAASTLAAMAVLNASPAPAVILSPPTESPASSAASPRAPTPAALPSSVPDVIAAPSPDLFTAPTPKLEEPGRPRDLVAADAGDHARPASPPGERVQSRESSGQAREPLPRDQAPAGIKRAASTVGSEMGWSMLETTHEEDEPEEEAGKQRPRKDGDAQQLTPKNEADKEVREPNKAGELALKAEQVSLQTDESAVKVEKDDAEEKPFEDRDPPLAASEEYHNGALVLSPEGSGRGTPAQPSSEPADLAASGVLIETPPRETHPTWVSSVSPRAPSPTPYPDLSRPRTPPAQTGKMFSPEKDGGAFSTPDNYGTLRASASLGSSQFVDTPSRFSDADASRPLGDSMDLPPLPSGIETPPRPHHAGGWLHYPGDATPPPPPMSDSFFHPRNLDKLNPRHLERSMSTMGVFGDAEPDGADVQERLKRATHAPRPSLDTSIHEMISPSVRSEENELRKLAGTELKDWYEGETRTPKTVRMLLPETDRIVSNGAGSRTRSALAQAHTLEPAAEIREPEAIVSTTEEEADKVQPETQIQPRASTSQIQRQPDRAQVYTSVLSRLMSHMDRRSSLMARLATRLGTLGGVGGPIPPAERHPREWVAQALPSGKVYWAHRLVQDEIDIDVSPESKTITRAVTAAPAVASSSKVLVIPTPSAPQPVMLVTDLDMSDPITHSGVNAFVDKNLQEHDVDLPSGWEIWIHASGTGESLLDGSKAERWDEVSEAGSDPIDLGYGASCVLVWAYVSHKRRRVGAQGPEDKFVVGEDAELDLEMERQYWAYVETHPAHADVNPRAAQEAIELLTWHYTDRLLAEKKRGQKEYVHVRPPFTPEESHEVLEFLKSVSADYSLANAVLKTRTVARVHVRTAEWRLAKLHAVADAMNLEVMSPSERLRRRRAAANPFVGVPLRTLASLLGLGIPYLYVDQPNEKVEDRQRMMVADASTNMMSALMLGASISFLAIPDLEDIARLAGVAAAACSLGSLAAGIVRLRIPSLSGGKEGGEGTEDEQEPRPSALRTFARSLPLVLSAYAGSALVAGLAAYSWRGQPRWTILLPGYTLTIRGAKTRLGVAGLGASCAATVGLGMALAESTLNRVDRGGRRTVHRV